MSQNLRKSALANLLTSLLREAKLSEQQPVLCILAGRGEVIACNESADRLYGLGLSHSSNEHSLSELITNAMISPKKLGLEFIESDIPHFERIRLSIGKHAYQLNAFCQIFPLIKEQQLLLCLPLLENQRVSHTETVAQNFFAMFKKTLATAATEQAPGTLLLDQKLETTKRPRKKKPARIAVSEASDKNELFSQDSAHSNEIRASNVDGQSNTNDQAAIRSNTNNTAKPTSKGQKPQRFLFALDSKYHLLKFSANLSHVIDHVDMPVSEETFVDFIKKHDASAAEQLAIELSARKTFHKFNLYWPANLGKELVRVELSAMPQMDPHGQFLGYRGFGFAHNDERVLISISNSSEILHHSEHADSTQSLSNQTPISQEGQKSKPRLIAMHATAEPVDAAPSANVIPFKPAPQNAFIVGHSNDDVIPNQIAENAPQEISNTAAFKDQSVEVQETALQNKVPTGANETNQPSQVSAPLPLSANENEAFKEIARALKARNFDVSRDNILVVDAQHKPLHDANLTSKSSQDIEVALPTDPLNTPSIISGEDILNAAQSLEEANKREHEKRAQMDSAQLILLDHLPIGLLVLKEDRPLFANRTLLDLLDYDDFAEFLEEGGYQNMFGNKDLPNANPEVLHRVSIFDRDENPISVDIHLQILNWQGAPATLLSMRRGQAEIAPAAIAPSTSESAVDKEALDARAHNLHLREIEVAESKSMLEASSDGIISLDHLGNVLSINHSAEALFGYSQEELRGKAFHTLLNADSQTVFNAYISGLLDNSLSTLFNDGREITGIERKGGEIPLFMTIGLGKAPSLEPKESPTEPRKFYAILRDISFWKRAERELQEARSRAEKANNDKTDFLAKISHEIRTPMNAIIGFSELMMEERLGPLGTERYREYLGDIHDSGTHVISLVDDLLDLSKIEAGHANLSLQPLALNNIAQTCLKLLQPEATQRQVILRSQYGTNLPMVLADERSIRQIVLNLVSNALKFTEMGGQVIVSTALLTSGEVALRIRDTGVGMSEAEVEIALQPFRQLQKGKGGAGLGLPLSRALAEANQARFSLQSKKGEGTLAEIFLKQAEINAANHVKTTH